MVVEAAHLDVRWCYGG